MQLNEDMAEGPICNALDVGLPVNRRAGYGGSRELGKRVEADVVSHRVHRISNDGCERSG
jgi:hypothetical protein